jgi:hypothetical protein
MSLLLVEPKTRSVLHLQQEMELKFGMEDLGESEDETYVYGYHDPVVTPNFLRRNEVCLTIDRPSIQ